MILGDNQRTQAAEKKNTLLLFPPLEAPYSSFTLGLSLARRKRVLSSQSESRDFRALFIARPRLFLFPFRSESKMVGNASRNL